MVKRTLVKALRPIGSSRRDEVRASIVVRGERLDPTKVTGLLCVAPTEVHRMGDPRIGSSGRVFEPFQDGMWELTLVGRRGEPLERLVERLLARLPANRPTWRRLAAMGQATLWCAAFLKNSTADFAPSADLVRRLADRHCALRVNFYADIVDRRTKRGIPLRFSISDRDVAACARCISGLSGVARGIYWIDVVAFDCVYAHTRPTRKSDPPGGNMISLRKTTDGWYVDEVVTFTGTAPARRRPSRVGVS
jgi:hypothetical protein